MRTLSQTQREQTSEKAPGSSQIRVMLVDDSLTVRTAFSRMIEMEDDLAVVATAASAEVALTQLKREQIDVILLDLDMPGMGGLQALPKLIETASNAQILVVSSLTEDGAEHTLAALSMGAADTMLKPRPGGFDENYRAGLIAKIRALGQGGLALNSAADKLPAQRSPAFGKRPQVLAIGASTGGIHAMNLLFNALPRQFNLPILVTQHLPAAFMPVFARQLEVVAARETLVAQAGTELRPSTILIAPGTSHLVIRNRGGALVTDLCNEPAHSGCMPSVDPMLSSIARSCDGEALAVILSGMGRDGASGANDLVEAGGTVLAQDEASSAVWGMPGAVAQGGIAAAVASPEHLAGKIVEAAGATSWI